MKTFAGLMAILALSSEPGRAGSVPICAEELKPLSTVSPRMAGNAIFEGKASLEVLVLPTGLVENVRVVSSDWRPVGRHGSVETAEKVVSEAVLKWMYPVSNEKCLKIVPIQIRIE